MAKRSLGDSTARRWIYDCAVILMVLLGSATARADTFRMLADDRQAIQARIDLIQQAQHDIVMAYYAVDQGVVPASILAVLQEAAERGVHVRLIVDGLMSRFPPQLFHFLESSGVEVRSFHPVRVAHPLWLNRRLHVKLLVVDGQQMIVGSRNLQDEHFGLSDENFADCDAYVCGASAAHGRHYFDWLWQTDDVQTIRPIDSPTYGILSLRQFGEEPWGADWRRAREPQEFQRLLTRSLALLVQCHGIRLHTHNDWAAGQPGDISVTMLHDQDICKHGHTMEQAINALIDNAHHTVLIESGYLALTHASLRAILEARQRGVQVTLVTNSLASTDTVAVYAAYQNQKRQLLQAGVHLWEFDGPETLHAKAMVIDGCTAMIGSYNFDPRSAHLNLELVVVARDDRAAADLQHAVMHHLANAHRVDSVHDGSPLRVEASGNGRATGEEASAARWARMQLQRLTIPALRWLL